MNDFTRRRLAALGVPESTIQAASAGSTLEPVDLAALDEEARRLAADLYRAMNESVSEHLASMTSRDRLRVFAIAEDGLEADAHSRMPADLLRAFTEALLLVDPAYDDPRLDPTLRGLDQLGELLDGDEEPDDPAVLVSLGRATILNHVHRAGPHSIHADVQHEHVLLDGENPLNPLHGHDETRYGPLSPVYRATDAEGER